VLHKDVKASTAMAGSCSSLAHSVECRTVCGTKYKSEQDGRSVLPARASLVQASHESFNYVPVSFRTTKAATLISVCANGLVARGTIFRLIA
jgi:hypothetical protein